MEATLQDVDGRIHISIQYQPTVRAGMRPLTQGLTNQLTTAGAHLGGVTGVYENDTSASFCRFGDGHSDKLRPRHIHMLFRIPLLLPIFCGSSASNAMI